MNFVVATAAAIVSLATLSAGCSSTPPKLSKDDAAVLIFAQLGESHAMMQPRFEIAGLAFAPDGTAVADYVEFYTCPPDLTCAGEGEKTGKGRALFRLFDDGWRIDAASGAGSMTVSKAREAVAKWKAEAAIELPKRAAAEAQKQAAALAQADRQTAETLAAQAVADKAWAEEDAKADRARVGAVEVKTSEGRAFEVPGGSISISSRSPRLAGGPARAETKGPAVEVIPATSPRPQ